MNSVSAICPTTASSALIGLPISPFGFGVLPAVIAVAFFAALPILRNAVFGLSGIAPTVVEAARGIGMSRFSQSGQRVRREFHRGRAG